MKLTLFASWRARVSPKINSIKMQFYTFTIVSNVNYWNFKRTMSHHKLTQFKSYKKEGTFQDSDIPNAR